MSCVRRPSQNICNAGTSLLRECCNLGVVGNAQTTWRLDQTLGPELLALGSASSNFGRTGTLGHSVANADELQNGPSARIAQPRLGQPHDAGVAARAIGKSRGDVREQIRTACLSPSSTSAGGGRPRPAAMAWFHCLYLSLLRQLSTPRLSRAAVVANSSAASRCVQCIAGERDAASRPAGGPPWPFQRGDDAALDLGLVVVQSASRSVSNRAAGQVAQQGPLMTGANGRECVLFVDVAWQGSRGRRCRG